ncbi:HPSE [Anthophora quadrimaculata]
MTSSLQRYIFVFVLHGLAVRCSTEELSLNVNIKRPIAVTDEKFLSFTVDPVTLLSGSALSTDYEKSINLARALTPAYIRLGGPRSSLYCFNSENSQDSEKKRKIVLSESDWVLTHQWIEKTGLEVIACISPDDKQKNDEVSEDIREIVSFSDHMGFYTNWQLGYECQTRCNLSASDFGEQTVKLRKLLNEFPRYSKSIVTGPDVVGYRSEKQRKYLENYFAIAAPALSAITWHPEFASITFGNDGVFVHQDHLENDKEDLYRAIGRFIKKQPLWIAESKPEECKSLYIGALILARRLGNAAKLNVNVFMRQPVDLTQPTPDYWVSLLHKTLVGREVFDVNMQSNEIHHVYFYCQCTKPSEKYEKGSVMIFGVNLSPEDASVNLQGTKITVVHEYILSPGFDAPNRMFAETVLLNNITLSLINNTVPYIHPKIVHNRNDLELKLQPGGIGFWVFPHLKVKSCMESGGRSKTETLSGIRIPQDLNKAENVKYRVTRSVQDPTNMKNEKPKQKRLYNRSKLNRELRKLKRFVKNKLHDYDESRKLLNMKELSSTEEEARNLAEFARSMEISFENNLESKLKEFKRHLIVIKNQARSSETRPWLRKSISQLVADLISLMSKIQTALETAEKETDKENRQKSIRYVRDSLKALYDFLIRANHRDYFDNSDSEESGTDQKSKRSRRDLYEESLNLKKESLLRKRSENDEIGEQMVDQKIKGMHNAGKVIQPSVVKFGDSDSNENTFYGFFRTDPVEGFPKGDVFVDTENFSPGNQGYDYVRKDGNRREKASELSQPNVYRVLEDENDYSSYENVEFIGTTKTSNDRAKMSPNELWKMKSYGSEKNDGYKIAEIQSSEDHYYESDSFSNNKKNRPSSTSHPLIEKTNYASGRDLRLTSDRMGLPGYGMGFNFEGMDFPIHSDHRGARKAKREIENLRAILDQEMINEDPTNSKDCNCRVIRDTKKTAVESLESEGSLITNPKEEVIVDLHKDTVCSNVQNDEDAEVFSELKNFSVERLEQQVATPNPKITRDAKIQVQSKLDPSENHKDSTLDLEENGGSDPILKTSIGPSHPDGRQLFRDERAKSTKEKATTDTGKYASTGQENSTPFDLETVAEGKNKLEKAQTPAERSSTTLKTATLSEETIATELEKNFRETSRPTKSSKRQVKVQMLSTDKPLIINDPKDQLSNDSKQSKKRVKSKPKDERPRESDLTKKAKTLRALRELFRELRQQSKNSTRKEKSVVNRAEEYQKNRVEQVQKIKEKLKNKREMTLQRYKENVHEIVDKVKDEGKRNLKRREVWEAMKESDDYKDMVDREKLAYILMYQPKTYDESDEVPITEIVRARNIRERKFNPKKHGNFHKSTVIEHPNPSKLRQKMIRIDNLYEAEEAISKENDKSYFALVEDPEKPRIFYYHQQQPENEEKRIAQESPPRAHLYKYVYNQALKKPYHESLKAAQYSSEEDQEESDEHPEDGKIYIIDPSEYKGGQPTLHLYRTPSKPRANSKMKSKNTYEIIYEPVARKPYKIRQTEQRKREDSDEDLPTDPEELLKIVVDNLDSQTVEELFKKLTESNAQDVRKQNFMRSVAAEEAAEEEETQEEEKESGKVEEKRRQISANNENSKGNESLEILDTQGATEQRKTYREASLEKETQPVEADTVSEVAVVEEQAIDNDHSEEDSSKLETEHTRRRRDTSSLSEEKYFKWLPSFLIRKSPRAIQNGERSNCLCLKRNPDERSSKLFKILKGSEYYEAMPVKNEENRRNKYRSIPEHLKIVIPSVSSDEHSSMEVNPIVGVKNPYRKLFDYQDASDSVEKGSESEKSEEHSGDSSTEYKDGNTSNMMEVSNTEEEVSVERSNEMMNLKKVMLSKKPEVLMVLPWANKFKRIRREAEKSREEIDDTASTEKVPMPELQSLQVSSSPRIPTFSPIDDIEKSLIQKIPLEKFTTKEDINEKKTIKKNKKKDDRLSTLIAKSIPKLGNVVVDSLKKAENFTGSVEKLIGNLDENYDQTLNDDQERNSTDTTPTGLTQNTFHSAIMNVKKFFMLLGGITHLLRG